jgi:hypothetical protein
MRILCSLALALITLAAPFSRGAAQTCAGTGAFQNGRWRLGVDDQYNSDFNDVRGTLAYGAPRSFYGGVSIDGLQVGHGGSSTTGVGAFLGHQTHLGDSPFQVCPEVWAHYNVESGTGNAQTQVAIGGRIGYLVELTDQFSVVPAAGIWWISTSTSDNAVNATQPSSGPSATAAQPDNGTSSQVVMSVGFVFNKTFTISPGVLVPSQSAAKTVYTLAVSINMGKAVSR